MGRGRGTGDGGPTAPNPVPGPRWTGARPAPRRAHASHLHQPRVSRPTRRLRLPLPLDARLAWSRVRDSLWFVPAIASVLSVALAALTVRADELTYVPGLIRQQLLFGGGVDGARGVLSAIAGSIITVTATVFSVTIVALQLAGSQYTPRVLRSFLADRPNQLVLGTFIGTFTFAMLVLRTVRGEEDGHPAFVPAFAVSVAVGLAMLSIAALIFFINHAARSIQLSVILERETNRTLARIDEMFPCPAPADAADGVPPPALPAPPADAEVLEVTATEGGYVEAVHVERVVAAAEAVDVTVRMTRRVGEYVIAGEDVAIAWPAAHCDAQLVAQVRRAVLLGGERTPEQDPEFGVVEISDIAVRAMSHAINDPTTAMLCIDRLAELLVHLGRRQIPAPPRRGRGGRARFVPLGTTFDRALGLAFDQLRFFAAGNPPVMRKLVDALGRIRELVPADRHAAIEAHLDAVIRGARHEMENPADFGAVRELAERTMQETGGERRPASRPGRAGHRRPDSGDR